MINILKAIWRGLFGPTVVPGQIWQLDDDDPFEALTVEVLAV